VPAGRALVVGAGGQVGGALLARLGPCGVGTWRRPPAGGVALDLEEVARHPSLAAAAVAAVEPQVVYVVGAMTWVDGCEHEPDAARRINRDAPAALAAAARAAGARTTFFSTDYVFDGRGGPYRETDATGPLSVYGETKLQGEAAVLDADPDALVVRTTVVWGPETSGRNFAYRIARSLKAGEPVQVPHDQVSNPTYNGALADAVVALADAGTAAVVHVAGPELMDRASFARRLAAAMGLDPGLVRPVPTSELVQPAARPLAAGLDTSLLRELLPRHEPPTVEEGVERWAAGDARPPWG
jgi:dTDP-4-dehydrorhamnose reductase